MKRNEFLIIFLVLVTMPLTSHAEWYEVPTLSEVGNAVVHIVTEGVNVATGGQIGRDRDQKAADEAKARADEKRKAEEEAKRKEDLQKIETKELLKKQTEASKKSLENDINYLSGLKDSFLPWQGIIESMISDYSQVIQTLEKIKTSNQLQSELLVQANIDFEEMQQLKASTNAEGSYNPNIGQFLRNVVLRSRQFNISIATYLSLIISSDSVSDSDAQESFKLAASDLFVALNQSSIAIDDMIKSKKDELSNAEASISETNNEITTIKAQLK